MTSVLRPLLRIKAGLKLCRSRSVFEHSFVLPRQLTGTSSMAMAQQKSIMNYFKASPKKDGAAKASTAASTATPAEAGTSVADDLSEKDFDPSSDSYHPINDAIWRKGEKTPYLALAKTFEKISAESKRLEIIKTMTNFFRSVMLLSPEDLPKCLYLSLNKVAPAWEGIELGVGDRIVTKSIVAATGFTEKKLAEMKTRLGDTGAVAAECRSKQRTLVAPKKLSVEKVFQKFIDISKTSSKGSEAKKIEIIKGLLADSQPVEARFIVRALKGNMRMGLAETSALIALANAAILSPPGHQGKHRVTKTADSRAEEFIQAVNIMKRGYNEHPNYDTIASALAKGGLPEVERRCKIKPGIPVKPMLAHPSKGIEALLERLGDLAFVSEYKYDGERAQVHRDDKGKITVFSRNQEDHTSKFPEVVKRLPKHANEGITSFILDTEVVAFDVINKTILPFQVLTTRKRKNVEEGDVKIQVCLYAFDIIYLNGESLISMTLRNRRELLHEHFSTTEREFMFATHEESNDPEKIQEFMNKAIEDKCEGLMVKALDRAYEIDKRSNNWLKLKKDYLDTVGDSLDVAIIGCYKGSGKRVGTFGSYLCAVYDKDKEEFQSLCKVKEVTRNSQRTKDDQYNRIHADCFPKCAYFPLMTTQTRATWKDK
ncbi:hypothetical protein RvY_18763-2 [Ramazzottius varieornatus]|uniref:DNA ligase n=1 Tax=Ramazzottius varieornatus TaxID=947166 RepID=A0A1D1W782_RAMVA|nr:hypothetical protein RvY_18763-2 [Ramazzottius varieornatus]